MQEQCTSACASAVCKHVQAHVHARPDWDQGILDQALDYVGAVPLPMLALISPNKVSSRYGVTELLANPHGIILQHLPKA